MKKLICAALAVALLLGVALCGCAPIVGKSPDKYEGVRWVTPDYALRFTPDDDCKGSFTYNGTKYLIQMKFDGARFTAKDIDADKELFSGEWTYEDGDHLYLHSISYNKKDYEALEGNFAEFYRLHQEKLKKGDAEETTAEATTETN